MRVHLDHNATTPMRPEAREAWLTVLDSMPGNPSSVHGSGRAARAQIDEARERVAGALGVLEDHVVFTSGGTEANNIALQGALRSGAGALVTTTIEHSSILEPAEQLEALGHEVRRVPVDAQGLVDVEALLEAAAGARLVSVAAANNEIGTLGPLAELGPRLREMRGAPALHTDAVQALGRVPLDLEGWAVDLASFSAHKVGGPVGTGVLVQRRAIASPITWGGGQELGHRPGTEDVAGIVAASVAIDLAVRERAVIGERLRALTTGLWEQLRACFPAVTLLGPPIDSSERLPNTLNVLFDHVDGRVLVTRLDMAGLEASAGSACASGSLEPSHVLLAMGFDEEQARAGLRLSLGRSTSDEDIHTAVEILRRTL